MRDIEPGPPAAITMTRRASARDGAAHARHSGRRWPWWLGAGSEVCGFCFVSYAWEMEVRCAACDRPGCPMCVVQRRETRALHCVECATADGE